MRSVADDLRDERLRETRDLTVDERIDLALALGRRDVEFYMAMNKVDRTTAIKRLRDVTRTGRRPSKSNDDL